MAPVPESVRRSINTSSAASRKRLKWEARSYCSRWSRVVKPIGSTLLMRKGSIIVLKCIATCSWADDLQLLARTCQSYAGIVSGTTDALQERNCSHLFRNLNAGMAYAGGVTAGRVVAERASVLHPERAEFLDAVAYEIAAEIILAFG